MSATTQNRDPTDDWRSTAAQLLGGAAFSTLCAVAGLIFGMMTIVIGALVGQPAPLGLSETQASWLGSLLFVVQPVGSTVSGLVQDALGRRRCLMALNLPQVAAWLLLYFATSTVHVFVAVIIFGISMGFMEAPMLSYIGEMSQPRLRGVIFSLVGIGFNIGLLVESAMGALLSWRVMVLWSTLGPVVAFVSMALIPESPVWLASKKKIRETEKALRWFRGWVGPEAVQHELQELMTYVNQSKTTPELENVDYQPVPIKEGAAASSGYDHWWRALVDPDVWTAFRIIFLYFIVSTSTSLFGIRPFLIEILSSVELPISPYLVVTLCGALQMVGSLFLGLAMKSLGKRGATLLSLGLCTGCCLAIGLYLLLPMHCPWLLVATFCVVYFSCSIGVINIPWILIAELIPFRARGVAGGVCAAVGYILYFAVIKTYYNLRAVVGVSGSFLVYGLVGLVGLVYLYVDLPETEGVSLDVVERRLRERRTGRRQEST